MVPAGSVEENLARHSFLRWHPDANELWVESGHWQVEGSSFLPEGVGLNVPAGVVLSFDNVIIMARIAGQLKYYELIPADHGMDVDNLASLTLDRLREEAGAR